MWFWLWLLLILLCLDRCSRRWCWSRMRGRLAKAYTCRCFATISRTFGTGWRKTPRGTVVTKSGRFTASSLTELPCKQRGRQDIAIDFVFVCGEIRSGKIVNYRFYMRITCFLRPPQFGTLNNSLRNDLPPPVGFSWRKIDAEVMTGNCVGKFTCFCGQSVIELITDDDDVTLSRTLHSLLKLEQLCKNFSAGSESNLFVSSIFPLIFSTIEQKLCTGGQHSHLSSSFSIHATDSSGTAGASQSPWVTLDWTVSEAFRASWACRWFELPGPAGRAVGCRRRTARVASKAAQWLQAWRWVSMRSPRRWSLAHQSFRVFRPRRVSRRRGKALMAF